VSIITLLTDFGLEDAYVGIMKGVILSVNPSAAIVDITHQVESFDLNQAAFIIKSSYRYFPEGSVHVVVVDPGVGSERAIVALKMKGHTFLAPDNGVLTLIIDEGDIESIVRVENSDYFLKAVSQTFQGRDIFAPVGAHISLGVDLKRLGKPVNKKDLVRLGIPEPFISEKNELVGRIVFIDSFGNCITNIDLNRLESFYKAGAGQRLQIMIGQQKLDGLSGNYNSVRPQNPLVIFGSFGYLEIAVNCGSARRYFGAQKGDTVRLILS
jgi:S-adenosylmethionine hydrolase